MNIINKIVIDWDKTKDNLLDLRLNNINLRKYVCYYNKLNKDDINLREKYTCFNNYLCDDCKNIDLKISRQELAFSLGVSDDIIYNIETGKTIPDLEELILYSKISKVPLEDIIVIKEK